VDFVRLPALEETLFTLAVLGHAAGWFTSAILVMMRTQNDAWGLPNSTEAASGAAGASDTNGTAVVGQAATQAGVSPDASAVAQFAWGGFVILGELPLLVGCLEFIATRRSAALPTALVIWHLLAFSLPALRTVSEWLRLSYILEWDELAYVAIVAADEPPAWLVAWMPLLLCLTLLALLLVRARVRAVTNAVRRAERRNGSSPGGPEARSAPALRMRRAIHMSDALATADLCGALLYMLELVAPLFITTLPQHDSTAPVAGIALSATLLACYYPLLLLWNVRLRDGGLADSWFALGGRWCLPHAPFFSWAILLLLGSALAARVSLLWLLPLSYHLTLGIAFQAVSALATLRMARSVNQASRSQLRVLHRTLRGGGFHAVPPRLQSVLKQRDATDIEAMLRGCHVRVKGVATRRKPSRWQRGILRFRRCIAWCANTAVGRRMGLWTENAWRLGSLALCCCPNACGRAGANEDQRASIGLLPGGGVPTGVGRPRAPAPPALQSKSPRAFGSARSIWTLSSNGSSTTTLHKLSGLPRGGLARLRRRFRRLTLATSDMGADWAVSKSTQHSAMIQLSPDFASIDISHPSGSRVMHRGHELVPFRIESAASVSRVAHSPNTICITFRQSGPAPPFVAILKFSRASDAAPWLAIAKLLQAPPEALPRRWRALYFRAFSASCAAPSLGLAVPTELDAFLRRLNLEPQVALLPLQQRGTSALEQVTAYCYFIYIFYIFI